MIAVKPIAAIVVTTPVVLVVTVVIITLFYELLTVHIIDYHVPIVRPYFMLFVSINANKDRQIGKPT